MTNCCPRPRMRWNGAIGAIARCKKVSTVCAPKSRSRHELRLICGEKPGARGVATLFTPYMRHGQDESNPVSLLQCPSKGTRDYASEDVKPNNYKMLGNVRSCLNRNVQQSL